MIILENLSATISFANRLAEIVGPGDIIGLSGDLGAGKTAFARAFIRGENQALEVPSPTFTLVQTYNKEALTIWHFDFYRLERPDEIFELGIEDAFEEGVSLIEWPEKMGGYAPSEWLKLELEPGYNEDSRYLTVVPIGMRGQKLARKMGSL